MKARIGFHAVRLHGAHAKLVLPGFERKPRALSGNSLHKPLRARRHGEVEQFRLAGRDIVNIEMLHALLRDRGRAGGRAREIVIEFYGDRVDRRRELWRGRILRQGLLRGAVP